MTVTLIRGDAATRPTERYGWKWFALRSYQDGGVHYPGQIGSEGTPGEWLDALIGCMREWVRVLKQSGSIWVNLGDSYAGSGNGPQGATGQRAGRASADEPSRAVKSRGQRERRGRVEQFTREEAAWLAGVIDSDGSIGIHINQQAEGRSPSFVPWVRVGQMRQEVVARIAEVVGTGKVMQDGRGVWNWAASAQQARWVLERIHPWLLIKKRQAWAAIEVARHVEDRNARGSWRPLTGDDVAYRQRLREAVLAWNQGQPDDCPVPEPVPVSLPIFPLAAREKSLRGLPSEFALRCVGELGLILRAEVIWQKVNGLPESVTDRVRRSHETWFHFVVRPRYYAAIDTIREGYSPNKPWGGRGNHRYAIATRGDAGALATDAAWNAADENPLGKLPGSVWSIPSQPLSVPAVSPLDGRPLPQHYAAFPMEWPRRLILGWSPSGICTGCGEGRRPSTGDWEILCSWLGEPPPGLTDLVHLKRPVPTALVDIGLGDSIVSGRHRNDFAAVLSSGSYRTVNTGGSCACPDATAPTRPAVVLDPFGGTGTVALVADVLGRHGVSVDMSHDYSRLAAWRTTDPGERARAMQVDRPEPVPAGQLGLFDGVIA